MRNSMLEIKNDDVLFCDDSVSGKTHYQIKTKRAVFDVIVSKSSGFLAAWEVESCEKTKKN